MNRNWRQFILAALMSATGGLIPAVFSPAFAQAMVPEANRSVPQDWSHRHLIYTNPETLSEAARKGTVAFDQWTQKIKDPRFAMAVAKKTAFVQPTGQNAFSGQQLQWYKRYDRHQSTVAANPMQRDWSSPLGGVTGAGRAGVFPAKFSFDINAAPDCTNDFVVYTTASAGATASGTLTNRTQTGTFTTVNDSAGTVTIANSAGGIPTVTLTASATVNTGLFFQVANGSSITVRATNLAAAINRNAVTSGVTATSSGGVVTVTAIRAGTAGNTITLAEPGNALTNFSWGAATNGTGTAGQPTVVAYNNMYKTTCGLNVPEFQPATMWAYNTGVGAFTETSPVLSLDGTQVAFVQRTGTAASLVLLKWSSATPGTLGVPAAPTSVTAANYGTCTAPCMTVIGFNGGPNNTNSSPYVDYANDVLYVGADNGTLHKFTGVFGGIPTETVGGGWPVTVSTNNILSSPVFHQPSNQVFVGSKAGAATGGQMHRVNATSGALVSSGQLATYTSLGVRDAPILDSAAQRVYAFVGNDVVFTTCSIGSNCAAVHQFTTTFAAADTGVTQGVGNGFQTGGPLTFALYSGTFDNAYYNSTPASPTGKLYVCGGRNTGTTQPRPTLWQIPIASNVMGAPVQGPILASATAACSPVTEIMNGANDYIYASVSGSGNATGCTGACLYMYNLTGLTWATAVAGAGLLAPGGTGGIIVDNISATAGASQIYYSTIGSGGFGTAVQASQAALQ